jgi:hypothetical protein
MRVCLTELNTQNHRYGLSDMYGMYGSGRRFMEHEKTSEITGALCICEVFESTPTVPDIARFWPWPLHL